MSSPLHNLERYWAQLGASAPAVQTLEGKGTGASFEAPKADVNVSFAQPVRRPGLKFD